MDCLGTQTGRREDKKGGRERRERTNKLMKHGVHRIETQLEVGQSKQRRHGGGGPTDTARVRTAGAAMSSH